MKPAKISRVFLYGLMYNFNMSEIGEFGLIDDVNKGIFQYIKQYWGWKFFLPAILLISFSTAGAYYSVVGDRSAELIILPFIWIIVGVALAHSKIREEFMRQFAMKNHLVYVGIGDHNAMLGSIFKRGHSQEISNMVTGERGGYQLRFFFFYYTVGSGKHKQTYSYTVCEIKMKGVAPDIIIESRDDWDFQSYAGGHQKEVLIESVFRDHFAVFAPEDFEIETLEIFTPDVLSELMDRAKKYNFEFIEDRLYVFRFGEIEKRIELEAFLKLTEYLVNAVAPKVFRLSDDTLALKEAKTINESR